MTGGSGHRKSAMDRIGYFGEEGYISVGDPYDKKTKESLDRERGLQMTTSPMYKNNKYGLNNGTFNKFEGLYNGEPYITLEQYRRQQRNKESSKNVSDVQFKPSNPPKKSLGNLGSFYGTVGYVDRKSQPFPAGGSITYMPQGDGMKKKIKGEVTHEPLNIVTNPTRKGTFGYPNLTIGVPGAAQAKRAWKGVAGEYAYTPDPYDASRLQRKEEREKFKHMYDNPWKPANPTKKGGPGMWGGHRALFDHPKDCGGTISQYHEYIPTGTETKKTKQMIEKEKWADPYDRAAFKPPSRLKRGGPGFWGCGKKSGGSLTFSEFPVAYQDPYDTLRTKVLMEKKAMKEKLGPLAERVAFLPPSVGRSKRTPSIFTMNIKV
ncbi:hypothetical protein GUITHDRAFT_160590 [Guillardia theta CCMP2712]|uniref:Cilia-and flagella-associated protein 96 n=3 Tax=Guillardia theta TaxID=55529 RepID=L1K2H1_GUITC|nr:hypothetical protein GUITHDRAFT_160590 [Guillardia theta CCMP2712]EKX55031.1 hypothetical protein GUITHDRAFT_160590 [Guillardia theta CCMP2712]|eukprot:XP_005842011.1 hypothetical protein GUITHDRAFT_160590 [Guillardia theta CCMP2712]